MGLYERKAFMQSAGEWKLSGIRRLIRRIFIGTGIFEGCGAILLSIALFPTSARRRAFIMPCGIRFPLFATAGFDLMGGTFGGDTFVSFTRYAADPVVSLTLCGLIIIGGLGFCVWGDIVDSKGNVKKVQPLHKDYRTDKYVDAGLFHAALFLL